jgi:phosphoserine phosphatase RsbU/P
MPRQPGTRPLRQDARDQTLLSLRRKHRDAKPQAGRLPVELHPSPDLLRDIIDSFADGVVVADLDGRFVLFNPAARRLLGVGLTDVPPSEWSKVYGCFLPDTVTPCPPEALPLARALEGESVSGFEVFVRNPSMPAGAWLSINGSPLRDRDGRIEGSIAIFRDVTAEKNELQKFQRLFNVVEQTADCVLVTDPKGTIEYVNPAFVATTGYSREEVIGNKPSILKSGKHEDEFYAAIWRTLLAGEVFRGTVTNRKKNGELFLLQQTITPMLGPSGEVTHLVSVAKDVTEQRKAAEQESKMQLARSVQQRLFPSGPPTVPGYDIAGSAFVADATGGDYFDFVALPGERMAIVIGDVSGHGIDSALVMAETRAFLRAAAHTTSIPGEILELVNTSLFADIDGNRFVTMLVVCLHAPSRSFTYASAGHVPGSLIGASGRLKGELTATGFPLGIFQDAVFETSSAIVMEPADSLLLVTDGISDSESPDGGVFGTDGAINVARALNGGSSSEIVNAVHRAARALEQHAPQRDDMTVVVCRCEGLTGGELPGGAAG